MLTGGGSSGTALCQYIRENNIKLPPDVARHIVAYLALTALDQEDNETALAILEEAEKKGLLDSRLKTLKQKIEVVSRLNEDLQETMSIIEQLLNKASSNNTVDTTLLRQLRDAVARLRQDVQDARSLGLSVDDTPLKYAEDIYNILSTVKEELPAVNNIASLAQSFASAVQNLQNADSVEAFAQLLQGLQSYGNQAGQLMGTLQAGISQLNSLSLNTSEARQIRDQLVANLKTAWGIAKIINTIGIDSYILGLWLAQVNKWIKNAYENPTDSPFGGARDLFTSRVADIVNLIREMKNNVHNVSVPANAPEEVKQFIEGLKQVADAIGTSILITLRSMKYYTTFNDYRWNGIWEEAENKAGVEWGNISKADVQRYEFDHCDETGCYTKKRGGRLGWLIEHMPEEILSFWTTVEDALNNIEMYNRWTMNYARNPILRGLGHIGYVGAGIIGAVGSLLAPRMLSEQLHALYNLFKEWGSALWNHNLQQLKQAGHDTWNMFFGSKERALTTLGALLLAVAVGGLVGKGLPKGARLPLRRAILGQLAQGDIVGAGLVIVERALPVARLRGVARALVEQGAIKASELVDDAGIMSKVLERVGRIERIKTLLNIDKVHSIVKTALKNSDNLEKAHANLERLVKEEGVAELAEKTAEYRAVKTEVLTNLESLKVHAPTRFNRLKNAIKKLARREVPVEELPVAVREQVARSVKLAEELETRARQVTAESPGQLVETLTVKKVVEPGHIQTLRLLDRIAKTLEETGKTRLAEAFKLVRENYEKLTGELERLRDINKTLDSMETIERLGKEKGLWKDTVELSRRKKLPGRGWLRKIKVDIEEHMGKLREEATAKLMEKEALAKTLEREIAKHAKKLELTGELSVEKLVNDLAKGLEEAGLGDLAKTLREAMTEAEKLPLTTRLGMAFERLGERLGDRLWEIRHRLESEVSDVSAENNPKFKASGLPRALAKPFVVGLKLVEKIADTIKRVGEELEKRGFKNAKDYETRMVERLAKALEEQYKTASLDNLALLKGLKTGLEAYEKTPLGTLLSELNGTVSKVLEAEERTLKGELEGFKLREEAQLRLQQLLGKDGKITETIYKLAEKLDELENKMEQRFLEVPEAEEIVERFSMMDEPPDVVVEEARSYAKQAGIELPDDFWQAFREYLEVKRTGELLQELKQSVDSGEPLTLQEVQEAINRLARLDLDIAWKADWAVIRGYLDSIMGELQSLKELAEKGNIKELKNTIEETEKAIRQVEEMELKKGAFSKLTRTIELKKGYSQIADSLEQIYRILERGLGKEKVKGLRKLLDQFEEKLARGEFDAELLKKMRWEIRKLKLKSLPKGLRMELDRLRAKLGEIATRLAKGKEAGMIEKALNQLADAIKEVEEALPEAEKGWVGIERIVEVAKAKFVKVPKEYAERVAKILSEREKTWTVKTREGAEVRVKRTVEVRGDGTLHIRYELDFPGKRKVVYDELVKADSEGNIHVYKRTYHDPEIARAVQAYEEVKKGLREMDDTARLGMEVEDILSRSLAEIDPDYEVLSKIAFFEKGRPKPVIGPLADIGAELLSEILSRPIEVGVGGATLGLGVSHEEVEQKRQELAENLPATLYEDIQEAIKRLTAGMATPEEEALLSLTEPEVRLLSGLYQRLKRPDVVIPEPELERLRRILGLGIAGANDLPKDYISSISGVIPGELDLEKLRVYIILPEPGEAIIPVFKKPEITVTIRLPDGREVTLPALLLDDHLDIILPPFYIELPEELTSELQASLQKQKLKQGQLQVPPVAYTPVPTMEAGAGAVLPPPPPILPGIPWMGGGHAMGFREREQLNI